jgi:hypothetical protein
MVLTVQEWNDWKQDDVTKEFFKALKASREILKEEHILGLYEERGKVEGKAQLLADLIDMKYEDIQGMLNDK